MLEIGGRAILVLMSSTIEQARKLCSQRWLTDELASYRSCGQPLWDGVAELRVRCADIREATELQAALSIELARREYEGHVFAFLAKIDPLPH